MTEASPLADPATLTRHIKARYHAAHRRQLPNLARLSEMIEDLHAGERGAPAGLAVLLRRMTGELEAHMKKEEFLLFPLMRGGAGALPADRIAALRADHDSCDRDMAAIRLMTDGLSPPPEACTPWITLYAGVGQFLDDLTEHIRLENTVLFPSFEAQADA